MAGRGDKLSEILISEVGELQIALRPVLPFAAEGFRLEAGRLEIFGEGSKIALDIEPEKWADLTEISQGLLIEFDGAGQQPARETDILREDI